MLLRTLSADITVIQVYCWKYCSQEMVINEQDSELVQWCLHLLDYTPSGYQAEIMQHDGDGIYYGQYHRGLDDTECNYVENDEIIARALQEEFSQLAVTEASQFSHAGEEQASIDTYDLHSSSTKDYSSGILESCC